MRHLRINGLHPAAPVLAYAQANEPGNKLKIGMRTAKSLPDSIALFNCTSCGACCACFRVDFSASEVDTQDGTVPSGLTVSVTDSIARMRGTDHVPARCAALSGKIGLKVGCGIYEWRPSPCREFEEGSDACVQARRRHGLSNLSE